MDQRNIHQTSTPKRDCFFMPGEFEVHERCWMAWPFRRDVWRNNAEDVQEAFINLVSTISEYEPVTVLVDEVSWSEASSKLATLNAVTLFPCQTNDAWLRDTGPSFLLNNSGELRGVDWVFNSWGGSQEGCYSNWVHDEAVASTILTSIQVSSYKAPFVLEGGSIHVDGEGTLITTEECLLNKNRNPDMSCSEIAALLEEYTGCTKIIWLRHGVFGDTDTDGHVDNLCFFVRPGVVALTWTDDEADPQHARR
jgi:agmatine deiminase